MGHEQRMRRLAAVIILCAACGPVTVDPANSDGGPTGRCVDGQKRCDGNVLRPCLGGTWGAATRCPSACDARLGCTSCKPGTGTCSDETASICLPDGSGYKDFRCDPTQGLGCNEVGVCDGPCAPQYLGTNYVGCEYFPTVTANAVDSNFHFAVAVSNTTNEVALVTIDGGALDSPFLFEVAPASVQVQTLPWVPSLKACMSYGQIECGYVDAPAALAIRGAYHLRSTRPVTVYQFNPLEYALEEQYSYSNDASLLIPTNAMTGDYMVATWPPWDGGFWYDKSPCLLAITATVDATAVTVTTKADTRAGGGAPAFTAGVPQTVTLNQGDVLELLSTSGDLTGSTVKADKAVQVIGGHYCTQVPFGLQACDHLEESMFPVDSLSKKYIVTAPAVPSLPDGKVEIVRIVATQPETSLTYDPPIDAPDYLWQAGDVVEIPMGPNEFQITGDHKILIAQFMTAQDAGGGTGDPAMALAVPVDQYRLSYLFHAPLSYETNYVNVVAPIDAAISLDGQALGGWRPIGDTGYAILRVVLGTGTSGNHMINGTRPFGISVYGYGQYTSYWYPGGLDLTPIPID